MHDGRVTRHRFPLVGYRWRFTCRDCDTASPWMSREGADLAHDRHTYETTDVRWSA